MNENVIGKEVVDAAVKVHRELGLVLLETVYEAVPTKKPQGRGVTTRSIPFLNGLPEENLRVFEPLRDTQVEAEPKPVLDYSDSDTASVAFDWILERKGGV